MNPRDVREAVEGSSIVYVTVGFPYAYKTWKQSWPVFIKNVIDGCMEFKSKLVFFDNMNTNSGSYKYMEMPKQARSQETLEKIMRACDALLTEKTIEQISMQEIAKEAGVSVGNLYNRFKDRDALIKHVIARHQLAFRQSLVDQLKEESMTLEERLNMGNSSRDKSSTPVVTPVVLSDHTRCVIVSKFAVV